MDHRAGDGGHDTIGGAVHQNWVDVDGGAVHQAPGRMPPVRAQSGHISRPTTGALPLVHHQRHGGGGGRTPTQKNRIKGDGLSDPTELAPSFRSGKHVVAAGSSGLCAVARKWAPPLGCLPCADERPAGRTRQADRGQANWGGRNLAMTHGKVCHEVDGAVG